MNAGWGVVLSLLPALQLADQNTAHARPTDRNTHRFAVTDLSQSDEKILEARDMKQVRGHYQFGINPSLPHDLYFYGVLKKLTFKGVCGRHGLGQPKALPRP
jgi:hypothetical protein